MMEDGSGRPVDAQSANRARVWRLRTREIVFGEIPELMGIVNVTPDSFSDGGRFFEPGRAVEQGLALVAEGCGIIDVGGESTRPRSDAVATDEELRRVLPVVEQLCEATDVPVSIDTSKARVAREAVAAGAEIINDVSAMTADAKMLRVAAESGAGVCLMHMQGTPQTMQDEPRYDDVVGEISAYLAAQRDRAVAGGVRPERIAIDPGIGFGKKRRHNLELLRACRRFHAIGCPVLYGHSRKGFIAKVLGDDQADPLAGTIGVALALAAGGVQVLRVHDVRAVREALVLFAASGGLRGEGGWQE